MNITAPDVWPTVEEHNNATKALTVTQDDRIHACWKVQDGVDIEAYLSECRTMILQDTVYTNDYFNA